MSIELIPASNANVVLTRKGARYCAEYQAGISAQLAPKLPDEKAHRRLRRLRRKAELWVETLIAFIDELDGDADFEPSLGAPEHDLDQVRAWRRPPKGLPMDGEATLTAIDQHSTEYSARFQQPTDPRLEEVEEENEHGDELDRLEVGDEDLGEDDGLSEAIPAGLHGFTGEGVAIAEEMLKQKGAESFRTRGLLIVGPDLGQFRGSPTR